MASVSAAICGQSSADPNPKFWFDFSSCINIWSDSKTFGQLNTYLLDCHLLHIHTKLYIDYEALFVSILQLCERNITLLWLYIYKIASAASLYFYCFSFLLSLFSFSTCYSIHSYYHLILSFCNYAQCVLDQLKLDFFFFFLCSSFSILMCVCVLCHCFIHNTNFTQDA